jgi:arabinose-5-phosphate isomerase
VISEEHIRETALRTIDIEVETLRDLRGSINTDFVHCVQSIFRSKGRLVVTGIGKSAIIAQKLVATFNSTGTPSLFMHAADAIHGDLGMIRSEDVVLCLSKSGETAEIKALVPLLKKMGNLMIGMVSKPDSFLGKSADFTLLTPVSQEADPNNLAPTASTTAQVVMGDALATALLAIRGFSPEDFALVHPGGTLGKQLYLRVHDIYPHNERPCVSIRANLREIILEMTSKRLGCTVVIDDQDRIAGIITDGDLRRMLEQHPDIQEVRADDIMTINPKTVTPDTMAVQALETIQHHSITQLIVAENQNFLGIIHLHDLIREGLI